MVGGGGEGGGERERIWPIVGGCIDPSDLGNRQRWPLIHGWWNLSLSQRLALSLSLCRSRECWCVGRGGSWGLFIVETRSYHADGKPDGQIPNASVEAELSHRLQCKTTFQRLEGRA